MMMILVLVLQTQEVTQSRLCVGEGNALTRVWQGQAAVAEPEAFLSKRGLWTANRTKETKSQFLYFHARGGVEGLQIVVHKSEENGERLCDSPNSRVASPPVRQFPAGRCCPGVPR